VLSWFEKNYPHSVALEIKSTNGNTIPRSSLKDHQLKALLSVRSDHGLIFKIPDSSRTRLPFDAFQMKNTQSFVIACFPKHKICLAIDPDKWDGAKPTTIPTFSIPL